MEMTVHRLDSLGALCWSKKPNLKFKLWSETHTLKHTHTAGENKMDSVRLPSRRRQHSVGGVKVSYPEPPESRWSCEWPPGGSSEWVLLRRFSRDWRKERRARSSSSGDVPSSSTTSAISAKVTGCVLKRVSRARRERLRPRAGPLGTGRFWGNSSKGEARRRHPVTSKGIWRTAAILGAVVRCRVCHPPLVRWEKSRRSEVSAATTGPVEKMLSYSRKPRC